MAIWNDLIDQAFVGLGVIQPGDSIAGTSYLAPAQSLLNQLISTLSTEQLTAFQQVRQNFSLVAGQPAYTLGSGGSFATTGALRAMGVTDWRATYAVPPSSKGGTPLPMRDFDAVVASKDDGIGVTSSIPLFLGVDTSFPLINLRVWPTPSANPGTLELGYWTPILQIADFTATYTLPDGWPAMLQWGLAVQLYPTYARPGQTIDVIAANFQNAKGSIVAQNSIGAPAPQAAQ